VIQIFRSNSALDKKTAKTIDELGLRPRSFAQRMLQTRDFKPYALDALAKAGIVKGTEDGRLYLVEEKLTDSGVERRIYSR
jgi:hypothetical protein